MKGRPPPPAPRVHYTTKLTPPAPPKKAPPPPLRTPRGHCTSLPVHWVGLQGLLAPPPSYLSKISRTLQPPYLENPADCDDLVAATACLCNHNALHALQQQQQQQQQRTALGLARAMEQCVHSRILEYCLYAAAPGKTAPLFRPAQVCAHDLT